VDILLAIILFVIDIFILSMGEYCFAIQEYIFLEIKNYAL